MLVVDKLQGFCRHQLVLTWRFSSEHISGLGDQQCHYRLEKSV